MNRVSVTIGIPAYNEEGNIKKLLNSLLRQEQKTWKLDKIIVCSDNSSDRTEKIVSQVKNSSVLLLVNKVRIGASGTQNAILQKTKSDILVLLDADVLPADKQFITNLIEPLCNSPRVGLVGANVQPTNATTFFGKIIDFSHMRKQELYESLEKTNPIYLCHGRARAFSKSLYNAITFPNISPEDAYSYLFAKKKKLSFTYASHAVVVFSSPLTFSDHYSQSMRFFNSQSELSSYFSQKTITSEYAISHKDMLGFLINSFRKNAFFTLLYIGIMCAVQIKRKITPPISSHIWQPSLSSKFIKGERG